MTSSTRTPARTPVRSAAAALAAAGVLAGAALLTSAPQAAAADGPQAGPAALAAAHEAATDTATLDTLSRFFAREGAVSEAAAAPRITGPAVPVHTLSARFVAGEAGAPVASLDYLASTAVSSDGQKASLWTLPEPGAKGDWQVVNIATGDDEARYAAAGARKLPGGIVFHEPQIDAWYVQKGNRVLPLDQDAVRAVGKKGTTLSAYRSRVHAAYADKLPGSAYARKGEAGGYGPAAPKPAERERSGPAIAAPATTDAANTADTALTAGSTAAAGGALAVLALCGATALRLRGRRRTG